MNFSMNRKQFTMYLFCSCWFYLPVRAILYGGRRLPLRAPRAKPAPRATHIAPTTVNMMYSGQSEPEIEIKYKEYVSLFNGNVYNVNFQCIN